MHATEMQTCKNATASNFRCDSRASHEFISKLPATLFSCDPLSFTHTHEHDKGMSSIFCRGSVDEIDFVCLMCSFPLVFYASPRECRSCCVHCIT